MSVKLRACLDHLFLSMLITCSCVLYTPQERVSRSCATDGVTNTIRWRVASNAEAMEFGGGSSDTLNRPNQVSGLVPPRWLYIIDHHKTTLITRA